MNERRYSFINVVIIAICVIISVRLINLQIAKGEDYRLKSDSRTTRTVELHGKRGEILDCYGRSIVRNRTGCSVYIQYNKERSNDDLNRIIANLFLAVTSYNNSYVDNFNLIADGGKVRFSENVTEEWKKEYNLNGLTAKESFSKLCEKFEIDTKQYSKEKAIKIAAVRLDMLTRGFSMTSPYLFCEDVTVAEVLIIREQNSKYPDVSIVTQPVREYPYGSLGAHILGRVGNISAEEYAKLKNDGYTINSSIGKDGIEKYMEDFLKGENGRESVEQTSSGYGFRRKIEKEPQNGRAVNLTIDLDMQVAVEKALKETIFSLAGANAGSAVVIDVNNGDILATASYPSYDIKSFNRNYNNLLKNSSNPLFNRAIAGIYSPASTFKMLIAAGALEENVITTDETIVDTGKYTYFSDYQPACWIYNQEGATHGAVNVSQAIRDSCNIFFYEAGRRLTIEKINKYAKKFGFGQLSGIELSSEEKRGTVASPENRKKQGGIWYPGDTCQTAIGQSDTYVTPIQLANYIATLANGGTRYRPHIIKAVQNTDGTVQNQAEPEILEKIDLDNENYNAIVKGMRMVVTEGTALKAFSGCSVDVAAKTGSAQTGHGTNGICVAYAPFDRPRIAIACVIENAGSGSNAAYAVRKIVDSFFENSSEDKNNEMNTLLK